MSSRFPIFAAWNRDPLDPNKIRDVASMFYNSQQYALAYHLFERAAEMVEHPSILRGLGLTLMNLSLHVGSDDWLMKAEEVLIRAVELAPEDPDMLKALGACALQLGRIDEAEQLSETALAAKPDAYDAAYTVAVCKFFKQQWGEGFDLQDMSIGKPVMGRHFPLEPVVPLWDGTPGKKLLVVGEQGLGDEISFASIVPDVAKDCDVTLWCDPRLESLFRRSLPCKVEGGRKLASHQANLISFHMPGEYDARCLSGSLGRYYRRTPADFPRRAFLVADEGLRKEMRARLDALPGRKIGIAWKGGAVGASYWHRRQLSPALLKRLTDITGVTWISLQYDQPAPEMLAATGAHHWPDVVQHNDYDRTAALVMELDEVVTVTTAIAHLSGALGKRAHVLVNECPRWFYGLDGRESAWYDSLIFHRQREGEWPIDEVKEALHA